MNMQERIDDLRAQHQNLEKMLDYENDRQHLDDIHISDLKKQKLAIKDEIASLETQAWALQPHWIVWSLEFPWGVILDTQFANAR